MNDKLKQLLDFPTVEETDKVYLCRETEQYFTKPQGDTSLKGNPKYKYIGVAKNLRSFQSQSVRKQEREKNLFRRIWNWVLEG